MILYALSRLPFDRFRISEADLAMERAADSCSTTFKQAFTSKSSRSVSACRSTFMREFKRRFQISPAKYLMLQRVEVAATRLDTSEDSIETIAALTGFYDRYHFTKVFKRLRGCTPVGPPQETRQSEPRARPPARK